MMPILANTAGLQFPAIFNAGSLTVQESARTQPQVGTAMSDWFRRLVMVRITKEQQDSQTVEKPTPFIQQAVIQPYTGRSLRIMREGQRSWKWSTIHATPDLMLNVDDLIIVARIAYRVMSDKDFSTYGYVKYHVIRDFDYESTVGT